MPLSSKFEEFNRAKKVADRSRDTSVFRSMTLSSEEAIEIYKLDYSNLEYLLYVKGLPFDALDFFARVGDEDAKRRIALKYPLSPETYEYLATQSDEIKVALYGNKKLPNHLATKLKNDPSQWVRDEVSRWSDWLQSRRNNRK